MGAVSEGARTALVWACAAVLAALPWVWPALAHVLGNGLLQHYETLFTGTALGWLTKDASSTAVRTRLSSGTSPGSSLLGNWPSSKSAWMLRATPAPYTAGISGVVRLLNREAETMTETPGVEDAITAPETVTVGRKDLLIVLGYARRLMMTTLDDPGHGSSEQGEPMTSLQQQRKGATDVEPLSRPWDIHRDAGQLPPGWHVLEILPPGRGRAQRRCVRRLLGHQALLGGHALRGTPAAWPNAPAGAPARAVPPVRGAVTCLACKNWRRHHSFRGWTVWNWRRHVSKWRSSCEKLRNSLIVTHEYLVVRRNGEHWGVSRTGTGQYSLRDYATLRGASLYRRRVIRARNFRLVETKPWDEA